MRGHMNFQKVGIVLPFYPFQMGARQMAGSSGVGFLLSVLSHASSQHSRFKSTGVQEGVDGVLDEQVAFIPGKGGLLGCGLEPGVLL